MKGLRKYAAPICVAAKKPLLTACLLKYLPDKRDLSPLADPNFILQTMTSLPKTISQEEGAGTGWRELGTKVEIVNL